MKDLKAKTVNELAGDGLSVKLARNCPNRKTARNKTLSL